MTPQDLLKKLEETNIVASQLITETAALAKADDEAMKKAVAPLVTRAHDVVTRLALISAAVRTSVEKGTAFETTPKQLQPVDTLPLAGFGAPATVSPVPTKPMRSVSACEALEPSLHPLGRGWLKPGVKGLNFDSRLALQESPDQVMADYPEGFYAKSEDGGPQLLFVCAQRNGNKVGLILDFSEEREEIHVSRIDLSQEPPVRAWVPGRVLTHTLVNAWKSMFLERLADLVEAHKA